MLGILHLPSASFFHAIYVIYPNNFISYLRNHFVDRGEISSSQDVATYVICPLLASVRLHPNLVLVGKDKELSRSRWHQRESHDFLDDSRRVVIGKIPIRATSDNFDVEFEQQESPPPAPRDVLAHLFPQSTSRNSDRRQNNGIEKICLEAHDPLSRDNLGLHFQNRTAADKKWAPLVATGDEKGGARAEELKKIRTRCHTKIISGLIRDAKKCNDTEAASYILALFTDEELKLNKDLSKSDFDQFVSDLHTLTGRTKT